jgi:hypothetical protein
MSESDASEIAEYATLYKLTHKTSIIDKTTINYLTSIFAPDIRRSQIKYGSYIFRRKTGIAGLKVGIYYKTDSGAILPPWMGVKGWDS